MQQTTISKPGFQYIKLSFTPHDPAVSPVDRATLHILLTRAMTEMYGRVGAGAISGLGDGVEVLDISTSSKNVEDNDLSRQVLLKVVSSWVLLLMLVIEHGRVATLIFAELIHSLTCRSATQLIATLPFSSASEQYSIELLGSSPSLPLARIARPTAEQPGSLAWIQPFEKA